MRARLLVIAASAMVLATGTSAEPPKAPPAKTGMEAKQVMLASADSVEGQAPAQAQQSQPAPKKRAARVTTCRCGDPQAQPEQKQ